MDVSHARIPAAYDVFVSYAHRDAETVLPMAEQLSRSGLRVFIDETSIDPFASIQRRVQEGIAASTVFLAWYSRTYARSRACQWELGAAFNCDAGERILVVNPEDGTQHILPRDLLERRVLRPTIELTLAEAITGELARHREPIGAVRGIERLRPIGFQPIRSNRFVSRTTELWAIHDGLRDAARPMLSDTPRSVVQVRGLPGTGKSRLAEEYALRHGGAFPGGVFWLKGLGGAIHLSADDREASRQQQIFELAAQVPLPVEGRSFAAVWASLRETLAASGALWIVDDVPAGLTLDQFAAWWSPHPSVPTLITTVDLAFGDVGVCVDTRAFDAADAQDLMRAHGLEANAPAADALVGALDGHPLALDMAISYLKFRDGAVTATEFAHRVSCTSDGRDLLEDVARMQRAKSPVAMLDAVTAPLTRDARDWLALASILTAAAVPMELVDDVLAEIHGLTREEATQMRIMATLQTDLLALSRPDPVRREARRVHTIVVRWARTQAVTPERLSRLHAAVIAVLCRQLETTSFAKIFRMGLELAHARELGSRLGDVAEGGLLVLVGMCDVVRGDVASATRIAERVLTLANRLDDADLMARTEGLEALVLVTQGDLQAGRARLERATATVLKTRSPGDAYRLGGQGALAQALVGTGESAAGIACAEAVFAEATTVHGPEHPLTLAAQTTLARILGALNDPRGHALMSDVVQIRSRQAAAGDVDLLLEQFWLVMSQAVSTDREAAGPILERASDVFSREFGAEHPLALQASLLSAFNRSLSDDERVVASADGALRETIGTIARVCGPTHPLQFDARYVQAMLLGANKQHGEAVTHLAGLIADLERVAPTNHHLPLVRVSYAEALVQLGEVDEGLRILDETIAASGDSSGADARSIGLHVSAIGALCAKGDPEAARDRWLALASAPAAATHPMWFLLAQRVALRLAEARQPASVRAFLAQVIPLAERAGTAAAPGPAAFKQILGMAQWGLAQEAVAGQRWTDARDAAEAAVALFGSADAADHAACEGPALLLLLCQLQLGQGAESRRTFDDHFRTWWAQPTTALSAEQAQNKALIERFAPWLPASSP